MISKGAIFTGNVKAANVINHTVKAKKHRVELPEDYFIDMGTFNHGNNISDVDLNTINNISRLLADLKIILSDND
ncbi:MAG: hypothetical protein M0D57_18700 [Sphingobacteriales bacterium JAD_PAG50586_3]|nr:MAG: hypothetical protein M0D57_18700 [Sphingobacteriales bacterium JAD_PAG50586_3]